jgi:hypothetical protein
MAAADRLLHRACSPLQEEHPRCSQREAYATLDFFVTTFDHFCHSQEFFTINSASTYKDLI